MTDLTGWLALLLTLLGTTLLAVGPGRWRAVAFGLRAAGDLAWIAYGVLLPAWPVVVSEALFLTVDALGLWRHVGRRVRLWARLREEAKDQRCRWCGWRIDPTTCECGDAIDERGTYHDGHAPVPMGCVCHRLGPTRPNPHGLGDSSG